jgi:hypothetical protein
MYTSDGAFSQDALEALSRESSDRHTDLKESLARRAAPVAERRRGAEFASMGVMTYYEIYII